MTPSGDTLVDKFNRATLRYSGRPATSFFGKEISYGELGRLTGRVAAAFHAEGVKKGDRIALLLPNCPYFPIFYFAALRLGAVLVSCNPLYTEVELERQLKDADARWLVTVNLKLTALKAADLLKKGACRRVVVCDFASCLPAAKRFLFRTLKFNQLSSVKGDGVSTMEKFLKRGSAAPFFPASTEDLAVLQYTGGTTGESKGAMLSHGNLAVNVEQCAAWFPNFRPGRERILCILPFFHVFAMTALMNLGLSNGANLILHPRFNPRQAARSVRKERVTVLAGVPAIFAALNGQKSVEKKHMSSLRYCISGGAPLPSEVGREFETKSGCRVLEGYGLSETSPLVSCNPPHGITKRDSIGLPVPGVEVSIRRLDDVGREVAKLGDKGEICVRGANVMSGYWKGEDMNEDIFVDNYLRTGDVGYLDQEGFIYLVDRIKDLIIVNGYNVYPRHLEEAICRHPQVEEAVVLGVKDSSHGEVPKAFIKPKAGEQIILGQLQDFLKTQLSPVQQPRYLEFCDELPKTHIGKPSREKLRRSKS